MASSIELLKKRENLCVMALLTEDKQFDISRLSLFERFSFLCENLDGLNKNKLRCAFLRELQEDLGRDVSPEILRDREGQKQIWRLLCAYDKTIFTSADLILQGSESNYSLACISIQDGIDVMKYLGSSDRDTLEKIFDDLATEDNRTLYVDMSDLTYVRPDPYHCELTYQKIRKAAICSKQEISALIAWSICRAVMRGDFDIFIDVEENISEVSKLLDLLEGRKLFPKIHLCIRSRTEGAEEYIKRLASVCINASGRNISLAIYSAGSKTDEAFVNKALYYLPICRVVLCKK